MGGCVVLCVFVAGGGLRRGGAEAGGRGGGNGFPLNPPS